jgi:hypothetical protein
VDEEAALGSKCVRDNKIYIVSVLCPLLAHLLVVGGGHAARAGTSLICVAAWAVANESSLQQFTTTTDALITHMHLTT